MKKIRLCGILLLWLITMLVIGLPSTSSVAQSVACSPVTATIASGFSTGGAGDFCWVASDLGAYVQSWGTDSLTINGVNYTNLYVPTDNILRDSTGKFYVHYVSATANGHFHATGDSGIASCNARWCSASQFSSVNFPPYVVYNNVWGAASGTGQTIQAQNYNNWSVQATFPETSGVKSYPNSSLDMNGKTLSTLGSCTSGFRITPPASGSWEAAYDVWVPSEVMIWMYTVGQVGPIARGWNDDGSPIPEALNVAIGGHTWNVYRGGANVVSLIRTTNTTSGTVDVLAILNWIADQGWISRTTNLDKFQFGFEITSAPGGLNFQLTDYWMSCGGRGTTGGSNPTSVPPTTVPTRVPTRASTVVVPTNTPVTPTRVATTAVPTRVPTRAATTAVPTRVPTTAVPTRVATTAVPTRVPTSSSTTCSPVNATITAPFTFDGAGTLCWRINNIPSYINSWNLNSLTVNGVSFTNLYATPSQLPAKATDGYWYISYNSPVAWGHFEAK